MKFETLPRKYRALFLEVFSFEVLCVKVMFWPLNLMQLVGPKNKKNFRILLERLRTY